MKMALRGVWQLKKLIVSYCDWGENKNERVVSLKNMTPEDILLYATRLRNALGRNVVKLKTMHVTKHLSVQGTWTTDVKF
uniref:Uncharacterized protein n=1 Tax=Gossypium raimondii TaxID=29730 RepID=A0A0D2RV35_GOSRA|nr:hypothetical protein B456_004G076200 [Gossypium raimondii]